MLVVSAIYLLVQSRAAAFQTFSPFGGRALLALALFSSPARAASFFWGAKVRRLVPKVSCRVVKLFLGVATRPTLTSPHHLTSSTHAGLHRGATTVLMACQRLCHQASASVSDVYPSCLLASLPPGSRFSIHRWILYCTTCRPGDCDASSCVSICCGSFISFT